MKPCNVLVIVAPLLASACAQGKQQRGTGGVPAPTVTIPVPATTPTAEGTATFYSPLPKDCSADAIASCRVDQYETWTIDCDGDGVPGHQLTQCDPARANAVSTAPFDCDDTEADWYVVAVPDTDRDGFGLDGYGTCTNPELIPPGYASLTDGVDCDDAEATIHLGALDVWGDGLDSDCDLLDSPSCESLQARKPLMFADDSTPLTRGVERVEARFAQSLEPEHDAGTPLTALDDAAAPHDAAQDAAPHNAAPQLDAAVRSEAAPINPTSPEAMTPDAMTPDAMTPDAGAEGTTCDTRFDLFLPVPAHCWNCNAQQGSAFVFIGNRGGKAFVGTVTLHIKSLSDNETTTFDLAQGLAPGQASALFEFDGKQGNVELWLSATDAEGQPISDCSPDNDSSATNFYGCS